MLATKPVARPFRPAASPGAVRAPRRAAAAPAPRAAAATEHARYVTEVAVVSGAGPAVDALVAVLQAQGQAPVAPAARAGLHPLCVPLAEAAPGGPLTCLLRWPEGHRGMELPVVQMTRGDTALALLARTPSEYLHRALAEEDAAGGSPGPVTAAAGAEGAALYEPGAVGRSGLPSLEAYLARRAGMFPDVCEALAGAHIARGDTMSGLITAEWYMRQGHFPDWGRPYEFACGLLGASDRPEEARDMARIALRTPWWTLAGGIGPMLAAAGMAGTAGADAVRAALEEQDEMANGGALQGKFRTNPKSDKQKRLDEATHLMNVAAAGEAGWDAVRPGVATELAAAGLTEVARFVELA